MNKKMNSSIRLWIFIPLLLLGIVSIISNVMAVNNIRNVNKPDWHYRIVRHTECYERYP